MLPTNTTPCTLLRTSHTVSHFIAKIPFALSQMHISTPFPDIFSEIDIQTPLLPRIVVHKPYIFGIVKIDYGKNGCV